MKKVLCSTGCIIGRPVNRNFYLLGEFSQKINCDGYELMFYSDWLERCDELTKYLCSLDLVFPTLHCEKSIGELISAGETAKALENFKINCECASNIGSKALVLHLWNGMVSDSVIERNILAYPTLNKIANDFGLKLTCENVVCNRRDPMTHLKELKQEYDDIGFTFDTKMAAFHSQLYDIFFEENRHFWQNICHIHVNDYRGGHMDWANLKTLHIGKGNIDFDGFFSQLSSIGYNGDFTVEATSFNQSGEVDFVQLNQSINTVKEYINKYNI
ncbi:MAG: sugar phosphate isomerase/epimerase [Oscillospiraceae bacterium]|nr:sugar phosphate isomerase/epimerase [Oscillospiraceae bacterium]